MDDNDNGIQCALKGILLIGLIIMLWKNQCSKTINQLFKEMLCLKLLSKIQVRTQEQDILFKY